MAPLNFYHVGLKILLVLGLVLLNGFFVAAEFALVKIRGTQLVALAASGNRRARIAQNILANLNKYLSATQLGITMVSLGLGWVGEPIFTTILAPVLRALHVQSEAMLHSISFAVGFTVLTFLHITAGELAPKWSAIEKPLPISLIVAQPLRWFYLASFPLNWILNHSARWLLHQLGIHSTSEHERGHTDEELRLLLSASQKKAGSTALGRDIVLNALDLHSRVAREVMRPRQEIVVFDTEASIAQCLEIAEKTRYSRFPLCEGGNLDKTLGAVHIKDLYAMRLKARTGLDLLPAARKLIYVPPTARLQRLLQLFLDRRVHMAIVVDEYGGTLGMVTIENILEEVVGQIQDEFDQEKPLLKKIGENIWEVAGALPLHELEELTGVELREEGVTTASGWVTHRLGGFPKVGDTVQAGNFDVRVEELDGLLVARMRLEKKPEIPPEK